MCPITIILCTLFIFYKLVTRKTADLSISSLLFTAISSLAIGVFAFILILSCLAQG